MNNRICDLFNIKYPIIQGGMVWCSGWKLASAVSNSGGLGIIGAGSMYPETLKIHINKCKAATQFPFAVNIPILYPYAHEHIEVLIQEGVKIVFTSAGNPSLFTSKLRAAGITVVHVIANTKFAQKAESAGVDALVAEGFEAGGHNGKEETTTMCLIPLIRQKTRLPLIAAGGIGSGHAMAAAFALGAEAVQIGSLFAASVESSAHDYFKKAVVNCSDGDTMLTLKELTPVRMIRNSLYNELQTAINRAATKEELKQILGKGKSRIGIFEGDTENGELEIGQIAASINEIKNVSEIMNDLVTEFNHCVQNLCSIKL